MNPDKILKGIRRGTRVAIQSENSPEYVDLLFALWRKGVVACLLSPRLPPEETKKQIQKLKCLKLIRVSRFAGLTLSLRHPAGIASLLAAGDPPPGHPNQLATIMLTSGSSGEPKAVVHTIGNHYYNAKGSNENIPVGPNDRWLLSLPLYHVSGMSILWRCLLGGASIAFTDKNEDLATTIKKSRATHISLVPTQLNRLVKQKSAVKILQKLKAILLGGGPIPEELIQTAEKLKLPVFLTYGLTEMASQVATSSKSLKGKIKTLRYRQLKITKDGEVLVKGKTLFKGYLQNGKMIRPVNTDGWFATGDLGEINKETGLKVLGRKDNMFISGGENIYPEEIEKALLNTGLIEQAVVVPVRDDEYGFRPVAFIKEYRGGVRTAKHINKHLQKILPKFKIPDAFYLFPPQYSQKGIKPDRRALAAYLKVQ